MNSNSWPPPPDLTSIQELMRSADPEGHLAAGAPADEYEPEEQELLAAIVHLPTEALLATTIRPLLEQIWRSNFTLDEQALAVRRPALLGLAKEIERFFGPDARPRTRAQILQENEPVA